MFKPTDDTEVRKWTQPDGIHYTAWAPPPWEPGEGKEGWVWDKTIFGAWFELAPNTPWCCNPASETYWCM